MDGAEWLQEFIDAHCPDAVRRARDFPHTVGYLAKAAQAAFGAGTQEASGWLDEWASTLKSGTPTAVLAAIRALPMPDAAAEEVRTQVLGYLIKRQEQIAYAAWTAAGDPIGSGMVESANKLVVEARLKGGGMHSRSPQCHADAGLTLLYSVAGSGRRPGLASGRNSPPRKRTNDDDDATGAGQPRSNQSGSGQRRARQRVRHPPYRRPPWLTSHPTEGHPWKKYALKPSRHDETTAAS